MRAIAACPFPHPALRATLIHRDVVNAVLPPGAGAASRREKAMRKASLRDFDNSGVALYRKCS